MARRLSIALAAALFVLTASAPPSYSQESKATQGWSQEDHVRIIQDVQKQLRNLNTYAVFD